jgi:hypothetical protein
LLASSIFAITYYGDKKGYFPIWEHIALALLWIPCAFSVIALSGFVTISALISKIIKQ